MPHNIAIQNLNFQSLGPQLLINSLRDSCLPGAAQAGEPYSQALRGRDSLPFGLPPRIQDLGDHTGADSLIRGWVDKNKGSRRAVYRVRLTIKRLVSLEDNRADAVKADTVRGRRLKRFEIEDALHLRNHRADLPGRMADQIRTLRHQGSLVHPNHVGAQYSGSGRRVQWVNEHV